MDINKCKEASYRIAEMENHLEDIRWLVAGENTGNEDDEPIENTIELIDDSLRELSKTIKHSY
jgi:hypothetical protein